ncbi:cytochrome P450 [Micromonospora rifamycinica]|uniref:Cytochrome P450 n=1 Tax=Micromonospora rifamycinica TaxID=291594 RepID=A0A109IJV9_9ACTN|nr:cytochrome P450 [Micromonospora rifamycinica]KWV31875.1 cytochrome [Micromonospora rifamycinica]SCG49060.1 Cytochrome P450 [Micromonospora rifamycinica]
MKPVPLPTARITPFDPPAELAEYREQTPIRPMVYPDGHVGWLVTSHALARRLLSDQRFSARSEFKRAPVARPSADPFFGAPALPGWLVDMDAPEHTRLRLQLAGKFTAKRMRDLRPLLERIVDDQLTAMEKHGPPADLVSLFALPVPSLAICELLGVPYRDRAEFQRNSATLFSLEASAQDASRAMDELYGLLRRLVVGRDTDTGGLLSMLAAEGSLGTEEIAGIGVLLLTAGHESTAGSLGLSVFTLLSHPEHLARLQAEPTLVDNAVEELLRYLTIFHFGVPRTPLEDVEVEGHLLRAGESITISLPAVNRDRSWFAEPDRLDFDRRTAGHMAFGYGIHQCLGQNLVRMEMRVALPAIFRRFPRLALAVVPDEVPLKTNVSVYGVHELPVTW